MDEEHPVDIEEPFEETSSQLGTTNNLFLSQDPLGNIGETGADKFRANFAKVLCQKAASPPKKSSRRGFNPDNPFQCGTCRKPFPHRSWLESHVKKVHMGIANMCECIMCWRVFPNPAVLEKHMRRHTCETPYKCDRCDRWFYENWDVVRHRKSHEEGPPKEKTFYCSACPKAYARRNELDLHLRSHSTDLQFECKFCKKLFIKQGYLTVHERIHTGEKIFQCPLKVCSKKFRWKVTFDKHMKTHVKCRLCDEIFLNRGHRKIHEQVRHKAVHLPPVKS